MLTDLHNRTAVVGALAHSEEAPFRRMRVAMVITRGDELGGAQLHVSALVQGLVAAGHDVRVIVGSAGTWAERVADAGVPVQICPEMGREIDPRQDLAAIRTLRQRLAALAPDLVCAHSSKAGLVARIASRQLHLPCIFTAHGWAFTEGVPQPKRTIFRAVELMAAPLASKIICVSDHDRAIARRAGIRGERLVTVHNGVPDIPSTLRAAPESSDPVRVVMVARFAAQKDHVTLIRAAADIPELHIDLVGDGPTMVATRQLVESLGIRHRVRFLGVRHDVADILAQSHIFVLASNFEGFPLSTLEAMRAGLPAIVSNVGGAGEAIVDHESGFLVPRGDIETMRDRLGLLASKPDRRSLMGAMARRRYEAHFSIQTMITRTLQVYEAVCHGQRTVPAGTDRVFLHPAVSPGRPA